jgi:Anti-sigma-K factor rskA
VSASDNDRIAYLAGEDVGALTAEERAELDELRNLLVDETAWIEPPPELEHRVVAAIADEAARARRAAVQPEPAPAATQAPRPRPAPPRPVRKRPRFHLGLILQRPMYAAAAIACVVGIAAIVAVVANSGSDNGSVNGSVKQPLRFAMVVSGTSLAPGAHGSATLTKTSSGWRIDLRATGLPPLNNGRYYQAWLKNSAGILVPIGTFNDAVNVTLWSGAPVTEFRTLTVTRQLANGNPASSGQRVLTGTINSRG